MVPCRVPARVTPPEALIPPLILKTPDPGCNSIPDVPPETILPTVPSCSIRTKSFALALPER